MENKHQRKKKEITGSFHNFTQMTQPFDRSGSSELFLVKGFRIFMVLLYSQTLQFFFFFNWKTFSRKCISMKFETCPVTVSFKKCNLLLTIAGQDWIRVKLHIILFWFPPYYFLFGQGWTTRLTDKGHTQSWVSFTYKNRRKLNTTLN